MTYRIYVWFYMLQLLNWIQSIISLFIYIYIFFNDFCIHPTKLTCGNASHHQEQGWPQCWLMCLALSHANCQTRSILSFLTASRSCQMLHQVWSVSPFTHKYSQTCTAHRGDGVCLPGEVKPHFWTLQAFCCVLDGCAKFKLTITCSHQSVVWMMFTLVKAHNAPVACSVCVWTLEVDVAH